MEVKAFQQGDVSRSFMSGLDHYVERQRSQFLIGSLKGDCCDRPFQLRVEIGSFQEIVVRGMTSLGDGGIRRT